MVYWPSGVSPNGVLASGVPPSGLSVFPACRIYTDSGFTGTRLSPFIDILTLLTRPVCHCAWRCALHGGRWWWYWVWWYPGNGWWSRCADPAGNPWYRSGCSGTVADTVVTVVQWLTQWLQWLTQWLTVVSMVYTVVNSGLHGVHSGLHGEHSGRHSVPDSPEWPTQCPG